MHPKILINATLEVMFHPILGYRSMDGPVIKVHWRLLNNIRGRKGPQAQWQHMAVKVCLDAVYVCSDW